MMSLQDAARALASHDMRASGTERFDGVGTDSRALVPGQLFVALRGERFDAHDFLPAAKQAELPLSHEDWDRMRAARKRIAALAPYFVSSQSFTTFDIPE